MVFHFPPYASVMNMSIISQFIPARVLAIVARSQIQAQQSKLSPSPSLLPKYKNHPSRSIHTFSYLYSSSQNLLIPKQKGTTSAQPCRSFPVISHRAIPPTVL